MAKTTLFGTGLPGNRAEICVGRLSNDPKSATFRVKTAVSKLDPDPVQVLFEAAEDAGNAKQKEEKQGGRG